MLTMGSTTVKVMVVFVETALNRRLTMAGMARANLWEVRWIETGTKQTVAWVKEEVVFEVQNSF